MGPGGSGGAAQGRAKEVVLEQTGHFPPMDSVTETAEAAAEWIADEMARWRAQEAEWRQAWGRKTRAERTMISEEWKRMIGGDPKADAHQRSEREGRHWEVLTRSKEEGQSHRVWG